MNSLDLKPNTGIFLPESFEWLILKSGIVNKVKVADILNHPEEYIDSALYFSWERFFTELLENETSYDKRLRYTKSHLNDYYLSERNIRKVLSIFPDSVRTFLGES